MAGLIPQTFIDDLLDRADIVEVVDRRVKLKKTGKNYSACCPFHQEKTASFTVTPEKQFYYCFGCGASGNALKFVMDYENLGFPDAVESLANSLGMKMPAGEHRQAGTRAQRDLYALLDEAAGYYSLQLARHPGRAAAVNYLKARGLSGQVAKQFRLGLAPPGWDNLLQALGNSAERKQQLLNTGMLIAGERSQPHDRFRGRIMFPIRDLRGRVIAFGGRVLGDEQPKYLNSPETSLFQKGRELYGLYEARQANRTLDRIIVVEGYMDVIALAQHGISNATATLGTATSAAHLEKIYRQCPEVVFCFDGDNAGRRAAARALETALPTLQDGRQARFLFLPEGEDPDTLVRTKGAQHFSSLVSAAMPLEDFLFASQGENLNLDTVEGRARLSTLAVPLLQKLPAGVYRQLMFKALAERTGMAIEAYNDVMQAAPAAATAAAAQTPAPRQRPPLQQQAEVFGNLAQTALTLLLCQPAVARRVETIEPIRQLSGDYEQLLVAVLECLQQQPQATTPMLLGRWYGTEQGKILNRLAGQERLLPTAGIEKEFLDTINALLAYPKKQHFDACIDQLRNRNYGDISESEKQGFVRQLNEQPQRHRERAPERDIDP